MKKQISVYRISRDRSYAKLVPVDRAAFNEERKRSWAFNAKRGRNFEWVSLEMKPSSQSLPAPDIWEIVPGAYALEDHAYEELFSSVEESQHNVNFIQCEGRKLAVVDASLCINCLNKTRSIFETGSKSEISKYVFNGRKLAISLFKIPQTREFELLTLDGFDEENDFKTLVELHGFTGLKFKKVWSGDSFMNDYE